MYTRQETGVIGFRSTWRELLMDTLDSRPVQLVKWYWKWLSWENQGTVLCNEKLYLIEVSLA